MCLCMFWEIRMISVSGFGFEVPNLGVLIRVYFDF